MKKTKKIIITVVSIIAVIAIGIFVYYNYFYDANKLNITEKKWLDDHKSSVITFNIPNDINVFSSNGTGVFQDYLDDFAKQYTIEVNKNIVSNNNSGLGFVISKNKTSDDLLFFTDHYVLVSKTEESISSYNKIKDENIGGLSEGISRVSAAYDITTKYSTYDSKDNLLAALKDDKIKYIIVPLNEYLDVILSNNYKVVYHFDDLINNYYIKLGSDETLNSIVKKYYNIWYNENFKESYYTNEYNLYIDKLGLSEIDTDELTSKSFTYGFVSQTPYETLNSSKYGGIVVSYLNEFTNFSKVEFSFIKYKNTKALIEAYNDGSVDLIFNNTSLEASDYLTTTNLNNKYYIIAPLENNVKYNDISEIDSEKVNMIKDSSLAVYLSNFNNLDINYVSDEKSLIKKTRKDELIAIDANTYDYYVNKKINNYHIVYSGYSDQNFGFKYQKNNDAFYKLFDNFIKNTSPYQMTNGGLISYKKAESSGNIIASVAKYFLLLVSIGVVIAGLIIASRKHLKLNTKIKKDEKLKFVDMLTSLKNRNYLNERINIWNQNTIYPQAIIVIDLNNIKYLNDTFGHVEGDKQIKAAANVLHQKQLDNTEIMRTDGNEFMVYLVGYTEKQVINYLKKLVKEFNNLPYEYGAAFGFSMIVDDLKLIDDAINEATIQMRENKEIESHDEKED